jgi:hypothetical protein
MNIPPIHHPTVFPRWIAALAFIVDRGVHYAAVAARAWRRRQRVFRRSRWAR